MANRIVQCQHNRGHLQKIDLKQIYEFNVRLRFNNE